jgi:hypothetical protein
MTQIETIEEYSGHAGIGYIMGARTDNDDVPDFVRIAYRRADEVGIEVVHASAKSMTTEKTPGESIQLTRQNSSTFDVSAILAVEPVDRSEVSLS